jgi:hypothetical protein
VSPESGGAWLAYLLAFCRLSLCATFGAAAFVKGRDLSGFEQAVAGFRLVPRALAGVAARVLWLGEVATALGLAIGGPWLPAALGLAAVQLILFTGAIVTVLLRGQSTACHCFGRSLTPVSWLHVGRNVGLLACAGLGAAAWLTMGGAPEPLGLAEWGLMTLIATATAAVWVNLEDIVQVFRTA